MTSSDERSRACARWPRIPRAAFYGAFFLTTVALSGTAFAQSQQPSASDLESARSLFKQGKDLRATGNPADLRAALDKFTAAHTYAATPLTALELGKTQAALGLLLEARETLLSVGRLKVQSDETDKSAAARTEAAELAEQLEPRIPGVSVKLQGTVPEGKATLTIDGAVVSIVAGTATRKLNPGPHQIVAKAGTNPEDAKTVTLKEGEMQDVVLSPPWAEAPPVSAAPQLTAPPGGEPGPSGSGTGRTLLYVGVATAGVGVIAGTITGLVALSKASKVKDACPTKNMCISTEKSDYDSGRTMGTVSTISFIVAGAGAAVAVVGLLMPSGSSSKTGRSGVTVEPLVGLGWAGVNGAF